MDKQGRLTKMDEWKIGEFYQWTKGRGRHPGPVRKCIEINRADGSIRFENNTGDDILSFFNWQRRYIHVTNNNTGQARSAPG